MELNANIEVVGIEAIAESRILLATKGVDLNANQAVCLSVLSRNGVAYATDKLDLISKATTFNAYNFIDELDERENYTLLFKTMLSNEIVNIINKLFEPKQIKSNK